LWNLEKKSRIRNNDQEAVAEVKLLVSSKETGKSSPENQIKLNKSGQDLFQQPGNKKKHGTIFKKKKINQLLLQ
jgi:hypothetical protein